MAQRSVLAQSNGSPKTSVSTPLERCWHTLRVKPGYTCKKPGIPEKYLGPRQCRARPTPRAPAPTAARTACSSTRTAPCALATGAKRQHRRCARRGWQVAVRTMRSCRHSASSATLARGLHRRVDPLAERQGALAAHTAATYASRQTLPQKYTHALDWHPHLLAYHMRVHGRFALRAAVPASWINKERLRACAAQRFHWPAGSPLPHSAGG